MRTFRFRLFVSWTICQLKKITENEENEQTSKTYKRVKPTATRKMTSSGPFVHPSILAVLCNISERTSCWYP